MVGVPDAVRQLVQQRELRRPSMSNDNHMRVHECDTEQSSRHRASDDDRRVDVFTVGHPLDPGSGLGQRQPPSRARLFEHLFGARYALSVTLGHRTPAHSVIVAR